MASLIIVGMFSLPLFSGQQKSMAEGSERSLATTVCDVRAHPDRYLRKQISIQAEVLADGMHGIAYFDPKCRGIGLAHGWALPNADQTVKQFDDNIAALEIVPPHRRYSAILVGEVSIDSKTKRLSYRLKSVLNLKEIPAASPASW